jgi:hypothetical protein
MDKIETLQSRTTRIAAISTRSLEFPSLANSDYRHIPYKCFQFYEMPVYLLQKHHLFVLILNLISASTTAKHDKPLNRDCF